MSGGPTHGFMPQHMQNPYAEHYGQQFGVQGLAGMMAPPSPHIGAFPQPGVMPLQGFGEPPPGYGAGMPKGQGYPVPQGMGEPPPGYGAGMPKGQGYATGPLTRGMEPMQPNRGLRPFNPMIAMR